MPPRVVHGYGGYWNIIDDAPQEKKMANSKKIIIGVGVVGGLGLAAWLASRAGASGAGAAVPFGGVKPAGGLLPPVKPAAVPAKKFGGLPTPKVFKGDEVSIPGFGALKLVEGTDAAARDKGDTSTRLVVASKWDGGWFHSLQGETIWYPDALLRVVTPVGEMPDAATWQVKVWPDGKAAEPPAALGTKPKYNVGDTVNVSSTRADKVVAFSTPRKVLAQQALLQVTVDSKSDKVVPVKGAKAEWWYVLEEPGNPAGWLVPEKSVGKV